MACQAVCLLSAALMMSGCESGPLPEQRSPNALESEAAETAAHPAGLANESPTAGGAAIREKIGEIQFDYSWPQAAARIPALDSWLRSNGAHLRSQTLAKGRAERANAEKENYPFRGYTYQESWDVVADLPALLVMQSEGYTFTGGAHGMPIVTTLIWDKARQQRLPITALLDVTELKRALNDRFCEALDAERAKRRGKPVDTADPNELSDFVRCVDLARQTILPISRNGQALDAIRFVILPYEAGPYAEGIYQLDLPVNGSVMRAVKPDYRKAFAAPGS
jgi:hypothetical protein